MKARREDRKSWTRLDGSWREVCLLIVLGDLDIVPLASYSRTWTIAKLASPIDVFDKFDSKMARPGMSNPTQYTVHLRNRCERRDGSEKRAIPAALSRS